MTKSLRPSNLHKILGKLNPDLNETFSSILEKIKGDLGRSDVGLGALKWLLSQDGECDAEHLLTGLCYEDITIDEKKFDTGRGVYDNLNFDIVQENVLRSCLNLVEYREKTKTFVFTHLSVQEYLGKEWCKLPAAHAFVAKQCLHRLLDVKHHENFTSFTDFAKLHWVGLVQQAEKAKAIDPKLQILLKRFLGFPGPVSGDFDSWLHLQSDSSKRAKIQSQQGTYFSISRLGTISSKYTQWRHTNEDTRDNFKSGSGNEDSKTSSMEQAKSVTLQAIDVACFFGLESLLDTLLYESTIFSEGSRSPHCLQRRIKSGESDHQRGFPPLSPATSPSLLNKYLNLAVQTSGITHLKALWQVLATCMSCSGLWHTDEPDVLLQYVETLIAVICDSHYYFNDRIKLLGATINLVLRYKKYAGVHIHNVAIKALRKLSHPDVGGRSIVDPFIRYPEFRWFSAAEELVNCHSLHIDISSLRCGPVKDFITKLHLESMHLWALAAGLGVDGDSWFMNTNESLIKSSISMGTGGEDFQSELQDQMDGIWEMFLTAVLEITPKPRSKIIQERLLLPLLLFVATRSFLKSCRVLICGGAWVSDRGSDYEPAITPLTEAISRGCTTETAQLFLELQRRHEEPEMMPTGGRLKLPPLQTKAYSGTPLIAACHSGNIDLCRLLLNQEVNPNVSSSTGMYSTPLIAACRGGNVDICRLLLDQKVDPNITVSTGDYSTALVAACYAKNAELCCILVDHGAIIDVTALAEQRLWFFIAIFSRGQLNTWHRLLEVEGFDVNAQCLYGDFGTALIAVCAQGNIKACRFLLDTAGADVNARVSSGKYGTALIAACAQGHVEVCRFLVEKDAKVDMEDGQPVGPYGTALFAACATKRLARTRLELCKILLESDANPNVICTHSKFRFGTALIAASWYNDADVCELLVGHGADAGLEISNEYSYTCALEAAEAAGSWEQRRTQEWKMDEISYCMTTGDMHPFKGRSLRFLHQHLRARQSQGLS